MSTNLITDPSFENGFVSWTPVVWDGNVNSVSVASSGAHNGNCCIHLSSTQAGQAYIYQLVTLTAGHSYTLSFYAKRTGNIDVWTAYSMDGNQEHLPSLMNKVGSTYSKVAQDFTLPGSGSKNVFVFIIAGSAAGDVWIDDVELVDKTASGGTGTNDSTGSWGTGQVTGGRLYCRKQPSKGDYWGQFQNDSVIPIKVYNNTWYETYWNNDQSKVGYVMREFITNESWNDAGSDGEDSSGTIAAPSLVTIRNGDAYLKEGDEGTAVITLRTLLNAKGYTCSASGAFDSALTNVVKSFQSDNDITSDGLAGQVTFALLEDNVSSTGWFSSQGTCQLTAGKLVKIGFVNKKVLRPENIVLLNAAINDPRFNFTKKIYIRHFLAQGCKETAEGRTFVEDNYHEGWTKAQYNDNPRYAPYCGSGFMQLTHDYNYEDFASFMGDDQIFMPAEYATKYVADNYPFLSAAWFWCIEKDLNQTIDDYDNRSADATVKAITSIVKGSSDGYSERLDYYENAKAALK